MKLEQLNPHNHPLTPPLLEHLTDLAKRITEVEVAYGKSFIVTSGLRTPAEQEAIYAKINARRKSQGLRPVTVPMNDAHIKGCGVDVFDEHKFIWEWLMANIPVIEKIGLWLEDGSRTPNWVHFQTYPPLSGHRIFLP